MKNIHVLPTDKPSRLSILNSGKLNFGAEIMSSSNSKPQHICITSDKEIKEGDWVISDQMFLSPLYDAIGKIEIISGEIKKIIQSDGSWYWTELETKKIIITTDPDLIKDGVQAISNEFLEWFVKNPSCEEVEVQCRYSFYAGKDLTHYKIIIPKEEPKQIKCYCGHTTMCDCSPIEELTQETLEKAAHKMLMDYGIMSVGQSINVLNVKKLMVLFAKDQQERSYSEEEVRNLFRNYQYDSAQFAAIMEGDTDGKPTPTGWFEKFKKK